MASVAFVDGGMISFCLIFNFLESTPGFASCNALSETPCALAILPSVSPATTTYSVPPVSTGGTTTDGGLVAGGIMIGGFVSTTGGLVSVIAGGLVSMPKVLSVGCSRLQPWMSMATRPVTLTASTQPTAMRRRKRRWLCCSSKEPLGTNGFGLFMGLA